jgi:cell division septal protein FtsQ
MSEDTQSPTRPGRSWREIRQEVTPRALSRKGRRRRRLEWLKLSLLSAVVGGLAAVIYLAVHTWQDDRAALAAVSGSEPVRQLSVITDGTITRKWVEDALALPKGTTLMELDLPALRDRLLESGQVRTAVVTRSFPDVLVISLQERTPVARVQVQVGLGPPTQFFVARDGAVYPGFNYDQPMVASLPWLDGVRLVRTGRGFAPVPGMEAVTNLLVTAQLQAPHLYRDWMIVSLARLEAHDEIVVRSQDIPEIIFSRREDFFKQVARLDYIADMARQQPAAGAIQSVNLALGGQVPVRLASTPTELGSQADSPKFNLLPTSTQRKGPRDL